MNVVQMKRPRPHTGATCKKLEKSVPHPAAGGKVILLPRVYVCPCCGSFAPAAGKSAREQGRWLLWRVECWRCGTEYEIRYDLAGADARVKGGWTA